MLHTNTDYKVKGYTNRWSIIDTLDNYALLENNTYGDETCYLVVKLDEKPVTLPYKKKDGTYVNLPTINNVVCETFDDIQTALEDEGIM